MLKAALCCALILPASLALAEKRDSAKTISAPPPVVPSQISVAAGSSVEIPLTIYGGRGEQLEFLIRSKPQQGRLSEVVSTGMNSAKVTYTVPAEAQPGEDRFLFAARSKDGVSAPAAVTISINAKPALPARLEVPEKLAFPTVAIGEEGVAMLEVRNPGSGEVTGELTVSAPWSIEGGGAYRIGAKDRVTFRVLFHPDKAGAVTGEAVFGPEPRRVVALSGEGLAILTAKPERLRLAGTDRGRTRMATLEIENLSDEEQSVSVSAGSKLMTEKSVSIPAKGKAQVPVFAEPGDGSGFQDVVHLASKAWKLDVPVETEPLQSRIRWDEIPVEKLRGKSGESVEVKASVQNDGGRAVDVTFSVNPPFTIASAKETIGAGEKKEIKVTAPSLAAGEHTIELSAATDSAMERLKKTFVVEAAPAAAEAKEPITSNESVVPAEQPEKPRAVPSRGLPASMAEVPNALGNFAADVGVDRASLVWPDSLGSSDDLHMELRVVRFGEEKQAVVDWVPLTPSRVDAASNPRRADFARLQPGRIQTIRVRSGENVLFTAQFATRMKEPWFKWRYVILTGLGAALAWLIWKVKMSRR